MKVGHLNERNENSQENNHITNMFQGLKIVWAGTCLVVLMTIINATYLENKIEDMKGKLGNIGYIDAVPLAASALVLFGSLGFLIFAIVKAIKYNSFSYIYPSIALMFVVMFTLFTM